MHFLSGKSKCRFTLQKISFTELGSSGGFRGGDGGDASPPTSLKVTILAEKSASIWNNSDPFRDASPPTNHQPKDFAEKLPSILVNTFFWAKKTFEFPISAEKSLSILVKTFLFFFFFFLETT